VTTTTTRRKKPDPRTGKRHRPVTPGFELPVPVLVLPKLLRCFLPTRLGTPDRAPIGADLLFALGALAVEGAVPQKVKTQAARTIERLGVDVEGMRRYAIAAGHRVDLHNWACGPMPTTPDLAGILAFIPTARAQAPLPNKAARTIARCPNWASLVDLDTPAPAPVVPEEGDDLVAHATLIPRLHLQWMRDDAALRGCSVAVWTREAIETRLRAEGYLG